ncbi:formylglycine-generating enzyme family protein [Maridesulfovibrio sp.]|uniref:formylglycine-generating enzyme family protein n=1 Tax=Maridesulfovibrio sp. TaxID=2795000 RepID=UPI002A18C36B|nr:formylglycine-generating enzyme family protein [Maridesulfovibrio sp.]
MGKSDKFGSSGAVGRSDLVRILNRFPDPPKDVLADILGYKYTAPQKSPQNNALGGEKSEGGAFIGEAPLTTGWDSTLNPRFWYVKERKMHNWKQGKASKVQESKSQPSLPKLSDNSVPPPKEPIVPWRRLWPVLKGILQGDIHSTQPDEREVLRVLSRGEAFTHIPLKKRKTWASFSQIIMDGSRCLSPFRDDFHWLIAGVRKLTGPSRLEFCCLSDGPLQRAFYPEYGEFKPVRINQGGAPLLIFSDLGVFGSSFERSQWVQFGRTLRDSGIKPVVLTPASKDMWDDDHSNLFRQISLDDFVHPSANKSEEKIWDEQGDEEEQDYVESLLTLLSPAVYIDTGLVRSMRSFLPAASVGTEALVWNHEVVNTFYKSILFKPDEQRRYRNRFALLPEGQKERALKLIETHHEFLAPEVQLEERLTQHVLRKEFDVHAPIPEELKDYLSWIGGCLDKAHSSEASAFKAWVKRMCWRQLDHVRGVDGADKLLKTAAKVFEEEWASRESKTIPSFLTEEDFDSDERQDGATDQWEVRQVGTGLHLFSKAHQRRNGLPLVSIKGHRLIKHGSRDALKQCTFTEGLSIPIPFENNLVLKSKFESITLAAEPKPDWAESIYRDATGLYAALPFNDSIIKHVLPSEIESVETFILDESSLGGELKQGGLPKLNATSLLSGIILEHTSENNTENGFWFNQSQYESILSTEIPDISWAESYSFDQYGLYADLNILGVKQRMRWIQPGTFMMGSPKDELDRSADEVLHKVTLTEGYWLADTACTQELWDKVMGSNPSEFKGEGQLPVDSVSWDDCQGFLRIANDKLNGSKLRFPTEAQWEYACRAGTQTPFSFGYKITTDQVNYDDNNPGKGEAKGVYRKRTVAVKELPSNQWGLYQMHGNVWEWCSDWYGKYPEGASVNPEGPDSGELRVLRGGGWIYDGRDVRSASRSRDRPVIRFRDIGFRFSLGQKG